jgi:hypothetical protein
MTMDRSMSARERRAVNVVMSADRSVGRVALALVAALVAGCSFIGVRRPHEVGGRVLCTDRNTLPIVDVAATGALTAYVAWSVPYAYANANNSIVSPARQAEIRVGAALDRLEVGTGPLLLAALSALYGKHYVAKCRERRRAVNASLAHAIDLTRSAAAAARRGDCNEVRNVAHEIETASPAVYATAFREDEAVVRCLDPTPRVWCFDAVTEGDRASVCLPLHDECERARELVPDAIATVACVGR